ncbi:MAG: glycosyltransferase [Prevotella sp.]|nr:glycosyltransferase [Prevotella sp.]
MKKMKTTTEVIKISIILPCYNVAQYIERSINSILSQNFDGYEIIIVNDGSTDNLLDICRQWELLPNFTVLSTANQGVSQARNEGLAIARGEYVFFL